MSSKRPSGSTVITLAGTRKILLGDWAEQPRYDTIDAGPRFPRPFPLAEFVDDPPSQEIADILNAAEARACVHGRVYCPPYCGVLLNPKRWAPIPRAERRNWLLRNHRK